MKRTLLTALANFINGPDSPTSGDELTSMIASEVMRRISPGLLMVNFSDVEAAHNGAYSLHLAGIRRADGLVGFGSLSSPSRNTADARRSW